MRWANLLLLCTLAACCRSDRAGKEGVVLEVDLLQPDFISSARWAYRVRLDDGQLVSGQLRSLLRVGDRVRFDDGGWLRVMEPGK